MGAFIQGGCKISFALDLTTLITQVMAYNNWGDARPAGRGCGQWLSQKIMRVQTSKLVTRVVGRPFLTAAGWRKGILCSEPREKNIKALTYAFSERIPLTLKFTWWIFWPESLSTLKTPPSTQNSFFMTHWERRQGETKVRTTPAFYGISWGAFICSGLIFHTCKCASSSSFPKSLCWEGRNWRIYSRGASSP